MFTMLKINSKKRTQDIVCVLYNQGYIKEQFFKVLGCSMCICVMLTFQKEEIPSGYTFCENGLFEYTELKNDIIINQYAFSVSGFYHSTIQSI